MMCFSRSNEIGCEVSAMSTHWTRYISVHVEFFIKVLLGNLQANRAWHRPRRIMNISHYFRFECSFKSNQNWCRDQLLATE